jgi:hypothetical protein
MQDRPTALELVEAIRAFLENDVLPELKGRKQFHTRVAINVLNILAREIEHEEEAVTFEWERLDLLLGKSAGPPAAFADLVALVRDLNVELSSQIREGLLDERLEEVARAVADTVDDKLRIANPGYAQAPNEEG